MSRGSQPPCKKPGAAVFIFISSNEIQRQEDWFPVHWSASLAELIDSGLSERCSPSK